MSGANFRLTVAGDLAAQEFLVAVERGEHRCLVLAAERHDVDRGELEVGTHLHRGHGDDMALEHRVD